MTRDRTTSAGAEPTHAGTARGTAGLGVFVGGRSSRMGGKPKGLLPMPTGEGLLVGHALSMGDAAGFAHSWLVGDLDAYDELAAELGSAVFRGRLRDAPGRVGPLGGLRALLLEASERSLDHVAVVACDMPHVTPALLRALRVAPSGAPVLAAQRDIGAPFEPMLARYEPARVLPALDAALAAGKRSFQSLFGTLEVARFDGEGVTRALDDWDTPEDIRAGSASASP